MAKTLRVQPISGKFLSATTNGKTLNVWLVDPDTNEQGTELAYEDAISLLTARHPVACLVQVKGKDGKYIKQLTDEELAEIAKAREEAQVVTASNAANVASDSNLQKLVDTQAELIKSQNTQITSLTSDLNELKEQMASVLKSLKKSKKTEE